MHCFFPSGFLMKHCFLPQMGAPFCVVPQCVSRGSNEAYVDSCVATLKPDALSVPSYRFIAKHGSVFLSDFRGKSASSNGSPLLPGSSSKCYHREQDNRLCFSVHKLSVSTSLRIRLKKKIKQNLICYLLFVKPLTWMALIDLIQVNL